MDAVVRGSGRRGQEGLTLMETVVAVAIIGMVAPAFLLSLSTSFQSTQRTDERVQSEALIRSQLETIEASPYLDCNPTPCYQLITELPTQYSVSLDVYALDTASCVTDGTCNTLQELTVTITRPTGDGGNRFVLKMSAYKVKR